METEKSILLKKFSEMAWIKNNEISPRKKSVTHFNNNTEILLNKNSNNNPEKKRDEAEPDIISRKKRETCNKESYGVLAQNGSSLSQVPNSLNKGEIVNTNHEMFANNVLTETQINLVRKNLVCQSQRIYCDDFEKSKTEFNASEKAPLSKSLRDEDLQNISSEILTKPKTFFNKILPGSKYYSQFYWDENTIEVAKKILASRKGNDNKDEDRSLDDKENSDDSYFDRQNSFSKTNPKCFKDNEIYIKPNINVLKYDNPNVNLSGKSGVNKRNYICEYLTPLQSLDFNTQFQNNVNKNAISSPPSSKMYLYNVRDVDSPPVFQNDIFQSVKNDGFTVPSNVKNIQSPAAFDNDQNNFGKLNIYRNEMITANEQKENRILKKNVENAYKEIYMSAKITCHGDICDQGKMASPIERNDTQLQHILNTKALPFVPNTYQNFIAEDRDILSSERISNQVTVSDVSTNRDDIVQPCVNNGCVQNDLIHPKMDLNRFTVRTSANYNANKIKTKKGNGYVLNRKNPSLPIVESRINMQDRIQSDLKQTLNYLDAQRLNRLRPTVKIEEAISVPIVPEQKVMSNGSITFDQKFSDFNNSAVVETSPASVHCNAGIQPSVPLIPETKFSLNTDIVKHKTAENGLKSTVLLNQNVKDGLVPWNSQIPTNTKLIPKIDQNEISFSLFKDQVKLTNQKPDSITINIEDDIFFNLNELNNKCSPQKELSPAYRVDTKSEFPIQGILKQFPEMNERDVKFGIIPVLNCVEDQNKKNTVKKVKFNV